MFFPEYLYQLGGRDQKITWLDPTLFFQQLGLAGTSVSIVFRVPFERVLVLQHAWAEFIPGAAQTANIKRLEVIPPTGTAPAMRLAIDRVTGGAAAPQNLSWTGSIIVPAQWGVWVDSTFNAGANVNTVTLSLLGVLLPIGNVQRV